MNLKEKYVNPFTDFGFKKIFGDEPNKDLLIAFLNQLLPQYHQIQDLTYNSAERLGSNETDRKAIFDLYCTSQNGDKFIVEMQKAKQNYFKDRSLYYATFPIQEQAQRGDWNFKLSAVYLVGILDFVFSEDKNDADFFHRVQLKNQQNQLFYEKLTFIYLEMPKFLKTEDELETDFDKWLYILKHLPEFQQRPPKLQAKVFKKLFEVAEIAKFDNQEIAQYEESLKIYRDLKNVVDTAFDEGVLKEKYDRIAKVLKRGKLTTEEIAEDFEVEKGFVLKVKSDLNL